MSVKTDALGAIFQRGGVFLTGWLAVGLLLLTTSGAFAQSEGSTEGVEATGGDDTYKGVTPGVHDVVEHSRVSKIKNSAGKELTWVGYQKQADKDRVFFQFSALPSYNTSENGNALIIKFDDTAPTAKNFERLIDTSAFKSRVKSITTDYKRGQTTVKVVFEGPSNFVSTSENGYIFFDFPRVGESS